MRRIGLVVLAISLTLAPLAAQMQRGDHAAAAPPQLLTETSMTVGDWVFMRQTWNWAKIFAFTGPQRAQLEDLARRTGVTACSARYTELGRSVGLPTTLAEADAAKLEEMVRLQPDFARRWKPYMRPCELSTQSMLKQLPDILMPEQRERYAAQLKGYLEAMEVRRQLNEAEMRRLP